MSTFNELSQLINVNDIYEPFIGEFDSSESVASVGDVWGSICCEESLDPMEMHALIKKNEEVIGIMTYEDLEASKMLYECDISPISGHNLISSDTPLIEAVNPVCNKDFHLVLKGNQFIGFLVYSHFYKLPFRLCLFALLIDLERLMLEITKSSSTSFLNHLPEGRLQKAKDIYGHRGFSLNKENKEYDSKLIDCTTFIDKFTMLRKDPDIIQKCPNSKNDFTKIAEKIRNSVAHPRDEAGLPIERKVLLPFIQWCEELEKQLQAVNM